MVDRAGVFTAAELRWLMELRASPVREDGEYPGTEVQEMKTETPPAIQLIANLVVTRPSGEVLFSATTAMMSAGGSRERISNRTNTPMSGPAGFWQASPAWWSSRCRCEHRILPRPARLARSLSLPRRGRR